MKKTLLLPILAAILCFSGSVCATSRLGDINGDLKVDLADFAVMASYWMTDWSSAFVTTWDTNYGTGTTVTLALGGTVDATIDWGDGSDPNYVTTPGPHVHDYGTDGIYTVSVTGTVTAYNSDNNGGALSERAKLIRVDSWGQTNFTSMNAAFRECYSLVSVPTTSAGLEAVTDMSWMFERASSFNCDIGGWDVSSVTDMSYMFRFASMFNQDLYEWCVTNIPSRPTEFDTGDRIWTLSRPVWGACPDPTAFVTTWDTNLDNNLRYPNPTVTLALAGTVNATIDWGDGSDPDYVTTPGPHFHDYGTDGIYTVLVTGTVTAYDSYNYDGDPLYSSKFKLISVNNWGQTGFTSMNAAFYDRPELVSVPTTSAGLEAVTDMSWMFERAVKFNQSIGNQKS